MIDTNKIKVLDGDFEIIYSGDFNIYENKLTLSGVLDLTFIFLFEKNLQKTNPSYVIKGTDKIITITLFNFYQTLGVGTPNILPIATTGDGKTLYFSIHVKSLAETTTLLKISLTFYLK